MAYVRYVKKEDPFVLAWENFIWMVRCWSVGMNFLCLSVGNVGYERVCQKYNFKSKALGHLIGLAGKWDWKQQKKDYASINQHYKDVQKAFTKLKTQKWNGKSDLQDVKRDIVELRENLKFHIEDFSNLENDMKKYEEFWTQNEIKVIKAFRNFFTPQLEEIKQFCENSLANGLA